MAMFAILLLLASTGADDVATQRRVGAQMATASVTIIQAERIAPNRLEAEPQKQDRQIRKRDKRPLVEFH